MRIVASLGPPELFELRRRKLGVPDGVLDRFVAQVILDRARIVTGIGEREAARVT